jgi:hypothetical protein
VRLQAEHELERFVDGTQLASSEPPGRISRRSRSTALSCSTRMRVRSPAISTSGLKVAGAARLDVGAITTVERSRNSSACTIAP